jgi:ketosteroid isomerase-like protein
MANGWIVLPGLCAAVAWSGCQKSSQTPSAFEEMIDSERSFSHLSEQRGMKTAFLTYLAEDGVVFRPRPVNGREWYSALPETDALLTWEPAVGGISSAGDLGCTTGPWEMREAGAEEAFYGDFVSVWRKSPGGRWQVVADAGTVHNSIERVAGPVRRLGNRGGEHPPIPDSKGAGSAATNVRDVAREFCRLCREAGIDSAFGAFADSQVHLLRPNTLPVTGRRSAVAALAEAADMTVCQLAGGDASGDLGYVYGTRRWPGDQDSAGSEESYLQVWTWAPNGGWKIVVDVAVPIAQPDGANTD